MAKPSRVIIESRHTGQKYSVTVPDFRKHYEDQGYRIVSNVNGTKYVEPKAKSKDTPADEAQTNG